MKPTQSSFLRGLPQILEHFSMPSLGKGAEGEVGSLKVFAYLYEVVSAKQSLSGSR